MMKLYHHKTDGGAEYLCSEAVEGINEGSLGSKYVVRIDGDITKDAELNIKNIEENERVVDNADVCELAHELTDIRCMEKKIELDNIDDETKYTDEAQRIFDTYYDLITNTLNV